MTEEHPGLMTHRHLYMTTFLPGTLGTHSSHVNTQSASTHLISLSFHTQVFLSLSLVICLSYENSELFCHCVCVYICEMEREEAER